MSSTTSLSLMPPPAGPKLNSTIGVVTGFLLIIWGLFVVGIQVYILAAFSEYGDGSKVQAWTDAYNGMAIASGAANILLGGINIAVFSLKRNSRNRLIFVLVLTTLGACGSVASIVLTAMESDLLNFPRHLGSGHPCEDKTISGLTEKQCTDWLALEVTVSVLSGLAFCSYSILVYQISWGLANAKPRVNKVIAAEQKAVADKYNTSNRPPSEAFMGNNGPYEAFNRNEDELLNPRYKYHLQQISLQQRAVDEMLAANKRSTIGPAPPTPVILSTSVSMSSQRGPAPYAKPDWYYSQHPANAQRTTAKTAKPVAIPIPPPAPNNKPSYVNRY